MKNWWLNLYTIPFLLSGVKIAAYLCAVVIGMHFVFGLEETGLGAFLYLAYHFFKKREDSFMENIEFHKISVPLKELKKIFYYDTALTLLGFVFILTTSFVICSLVNGYSLSGVKEVLKLFIGTPSYSILFGSFCMILVVWSKYAHNCRAANKEILKRAQDFYKVKKAKNNKSIVKRVLMFFVMLLAAGVGAIIAIILVKKVESSPFMGIILSLGFVGIANIYNFYRLSFNLEPSMFRVKKSSKFLMYSLGAYASLVLVCGMMFRMEVNSPDFSAQNRAQALSLFYLFSPTLESDTVADLLEVDPDGADYIWRNAHKGVWQEPLTHVYDGKNLYVWDQYLTYGKPSEANLFYMLNELENRPEANEWRESWHYHSVRVKIVRFLPEASRLPKELQAPEKHRRPASKPVPKKKGP